MSLIHSKKVARESALKALYAMTLGDIELDLALETDVIQFEFTPDAFAFLQRLVQQASNQEWDEKYSIFLAKSWNLDRIAIIDKLVLRLACVELWIEDSTPPKVTLSEWVRIAKLYGSEESGKFVNGILAKVLESSPKAEWVAVPESLPKPTKKASNLKVTKSKSNPSWTIKSSEP